MHRNATRIFLRIEDMRGLVLSRIGTKPNRLLLSRHGFKVMARIDCTIYKNTKPRTWPCKLNDIPSIQNTDLPERSSKTCQGVCSFLRSLSAPSRPPLLSFPFSPQSQLCSSCRRLTTTPSGCAQKAKSSSVGAKKVIGDLQGQQH